MVRGRADGLCRRPLPAPTCRGLSEKEIFTHRYATPYFFSAPVFEEQTFDMEFVELEKVYRQTDQDFIALLNAIRNRTCTEGGLRGGLTNVSTDFVPPDDTFCVTLTSTNDLATARNLEKLSSLPGGQLEYGIGPDRRLRPFIPACGGNPEVQRSGPR